MKRIAFIFPHQLFKYHPVIREKPQKVLLIEHPLFFGDVRYPIRMHKQKLAYHRATMSAYRDALEKAGVDAVLMTYQRDQDPLIDLCSKLEKDAIDELIVADVHDYELSRRLVVAAENAGLALRILDTPGFLNTSQHNISWRQTRKRWFMADFYQWQRLRLNILVDENKPVGGKWSFDSENRRKLPKKALASLPVLPTIRLCPHIRASITTILEEFPDNPGSLDSWHYPITAQAAEKWLEVFLAERLEQFGPYEDAIVDNENTLYHSVLTPMLNAGLLTPEKVIERTLAYADQNDVPLSSLEGFVRQIIGWREFMRATYEDLGVNMRTSNHWQHNRSMPDEFYTASTGIDPVDNAIQRVLETGYCHHIERLMILGGFMFLCEIKPGDIYTWFMEMFIDSYDWVMVPNVYAMSQHADGGAITTKPYFSGSNYVIKMSHYKKGAWSDIWDALFWRWIFKHSDSLKSNPRWAMMVKNAERMQESKRVAHLAVARDYLAHLDRGVQ